MNTKNRMTMPLAADAMQELKKAVAEYQLIVVPTDTVYGIGVKPTDPDAITKLLAAKGRDRQMPPPVVGASLTDLQAFCAPVKYDLEALAETFWPGALTLILPTAEGFTLDLSTNNRTIAIRVPGHEGLLSVLQQTGPLALTSANLTGKPPATTCAQAIEYFGSKVSFYLEDDTEGSGTASTILDLTQDTPTILRAGGVGASELSDCLGTQVAGR
ncbi:threonylcarbamoyl-AMP synthase [Boudabousia liubingyangii]|uniref:L-threonylcarbamoyladenylate synthase n=1 Tax=Boudabousia liubingyangii TaxID=1921764 RepID=A0A1Q5PKW5_9ACTO|nr:L-threonylcarbamoyladenylate synthase [Boudabousia liubingyangii]OKL46426.1 threonylcarbamoyl-AMP synthase [Boudabousia liubingyangii]OKL47251.1 threonylcarbamoyl-AMP synthase [Boudabousia liubingyangii]